MTPGPMARSWFGSAPTPSGNRLATMMKKRSAVAASLRRRIASSRSRRTSVRTTASTSVDRQLDHTGARVERGLLMRRIDDAAAGLEMLRDQLLGEARCRRIERGEG